MGGSAVITRHFVDGIGSEAVIFVLVSRFRKVFPEELVTLM